MKISSFKTVKSRFYCLNCVDKTPDLYHAEYVPFDSASSIVTLIDYVSLLVDFRRAEAKAKLASPATNTTESGKPPTTEISNPPQGCCTIQ